MWRGLAAHGALPTSKPQLWRIKLSPDMVPRVREWERLSLIQNHCLRESNVFQPDCRLKSLWGLCIITRAWAPQADTYWIGPERVAKELLRWFSWPDESHDQTRWKPLPYVSACCIRWVDVPYVVRNSSFLGKRKLVFFLLLSNSVPERDWPQQVLWNFIPYLQPKVLR